LNRSHDPRTSRAPVVKRGARFVPLLRWGGWRKRLVRRVPHALGWGEAKRPLKNVPRRGKQPSVGVGWHLGVNSASDPSGERQTSSAGWQVWFTEGLQHATARGSAAPAVDGGLGSP
jgi:hypothetical protein